jgi:hypothetical protein
MIVVVVVVVGGGGGRRPHHLDGHPCRRDDSRRLGGAASIQVVGMAVHVVFVVVCVS